MSAALSPILPQSCSSRPRALSRDWLSRLCKICPLTKGLLYVSENSPKAMVKSRSLPIIIVLLLCLERSYVKIWAPSEQIEEMGKKRQHLKIP